MLTKRHLAVLRAALQFFDEELMPHGSKAMRPYFSKPLSPAPSPEETQELRAFLENCELRYICCDPTTAQVHSSELSMTGKAASAMSTSQTCRIASVLLPAPS